MSDSESQIEIRPAQPNDVPRLVAMIRGIAEYEKLTHQLQVDESTLNESLFGSNPVPRALVGTINSVIVGYAIYFYNFSTFIGSPGIHLEDLYVDTKYRGSGLGTALFKQVAKIAHDENCGRMEWMVLDWNKPALDFYNCQGARLLEEWRLLRLTRPELEALANGS